MKMIHKVITVLLILFLAYGCEEVIEIDLNSSNPVIVAEAVAEYGEPAWLRLSYTSDYFDTETSLKIENATVVLSSGDGSTEELIYSGNGIYHSSNTISVEESYTLEFEIDGKPYSASTYVHAPSEILDIVFEEAKVQRPSESGTSYISKVHFRDIQEEHNYYMLKFKINEEAMDDRYFLVDDEMFVNDGSLEYTPRMLFFEKGDQVEIELYSIDKTAYTYYNQLGDNLGGGMHGSSTPYNPTSNFGTDVLGFFVGWSRSSGSAIVE